MIQLNLDCEGPITINDNALELCIEFLPNGKEFFYKISRYDDYLYYIEKREGYKAGDTLKLILPFLIAFDVTLDKMTDFSRRNLSLLRHARELLPALNQKVPTFIISTSYCPYLKALSTELGLDTSNIYCTILNDEIFLIDKNEKEKLREIYSEIIKLPELDLSGVKLPSELSLECEYAVKKLNFFFWYEIEATNIGKKVYKGVNPIGGKEKANAIIDAASKTGISLKNSIYIGDSITDMEAFELVRSNGGVTIAFNGNEYALRSAEFALAGKDFTPIYYLVETLIKLGIDYPRTNLHTIQDLLSNSIKDDFLNLNPITPENFDEIGRRSKYFRDLVRGKIIADLG